MRIGVGTIGGLSEPDLDSSKLAFGEDIERPLVFLGPGDGDGDAVGNGDNASTG